MMSALLPRVTPKQGAASTLRAWTAATIFPRSLRQPGTFRYTPRRSPGQVVDDVLID
jgi:hypothetical protein